MIDMLIGTYGVITGLSVKMQLSPKILMINAAWSTGEGELWGQLWGVLYEFSVKYKDGCHTSIGITITKIRHFHDCNLCSGNLYSWKDRLDMLTHCGLMAPYEDIDLGQHWLR